MTICNICHNSFMYKKTLVKHYRTIHKIIPKICKVCDEIFDNNNNLKLHMLESHDKCFNCNIVIKHHKMRHLNRCDKCPYKVFQFGGNSVDSKVLLALQSISLPIKWFLERRVKFVKYTTNEQGELVVDRESTANFRN